MHLSNLIEMYDDQMKPKKKKLSDALPLQKISSLQFDATTILPKAVKGGSLQFNMPSYSRSKTGKDSGLEGFDRAELMKIIAA